MKRAAAGMPDAPPTAPRGLQVLRPITAREAIALQAARRDAVFIAGGTALQLGWNEGIPSVLIAVDALHEAQGVRLAGQTLRIGTAVRLEALRHDALVREHAPLLAQACGEIGAFGVRNLATLGGNIAWRMGDTLPALLAAEALAELADGRCLPLAGLLKAGTLPLLVAVHWPLHPLAFSFFEKLSHRASFSPSRLTVAGLQGPGPLCLAAGAAGLPARRLLHCETLLQRDADASDSALSDAALADLAGDATRARLLQRVLRGHLAARPLAESAR
ncbi:FAD binding domain-containing protein [Niveibacterium sp. SC-1]|uniref:FAD binding domain-containing protein n=1 Tax=Niveibacterium sp. SC-1 TaxID=3135646 RepID=UPI00311DC18B